MLKFHGSKNWTAQDRLDLIACLLPDLQTSIDAGNYSKPGRPNITSLQHIMFDPPDVLEAYRKTIDDDVLQSEAAQSVLQDLLKLRSGN